MTGASYERPGANVILVRSLLYGIGAGGLVGFVIGLVAGLDDPDVLLVALAVGGFGAVFGGATGLVLGIPILFGPRTAGTGFRVVVAVGAMICVLGLLLILFGTQSWSWYLLLFIFPAGLAAWILLPVVLRPVARGEMPKLPGQST